MHNTMIKEKLFWEKMRRSLDFFVKQNARKERQIKPKHATGQFFDMILMVACPIDIDFIH